MSIQAIRTKLESGFYSFAELDLAEQAELVGFFTWRHGEGFSQEQRDMLTGLFVKVEASVQQAIDAFNAGPQPSKLMPREDTHGNKWLAVDVLTDCYNPDNTFYSIQAALMVCKVQTVPESDWPQQVIEDVT